MQHWPLVVTVVWACWTAVAGSQTPVQTSPATVPDPAFSLFRQVPASHRNVLLVPDLLPRIERIVTSRTFREAVLACTDAVRTGHRSAVQDILLTVPVEGNVHDWLREQCRLVPREFALAWADGGDRQLSAWLRVQALAFQHHRLLNATSSVAPQPSRDVIEREVVNTLERLQVPQATLWVRFRRETDALSIYSALVRGLKERAQQRGGIAEPRSPTLWHVRGRLSNFLRVEEALRWLSVASFVRPSGIDLRTRALLEPIGDIPVELWLAQMEDGICITLGPRPSQQEPRLASHDLGPLWSPTDDLLLFYHNGPSQVDLRATAGEQLLIVHQRPGVKGARSIRRSGLLGMVPPAAEIVSLHGADSLADALAEPWFIIDAATNEIRLPEGYTTRKEAFLNFSLPSLHPGAAQAYTLYQEYVRREGEAIFEPPFGVLVRTQGRVVRLAVRQRSPDGWIAQSELRDLPALELAIVARVRNAGKVTMFVDGAYQRLAAVFLADATGALRSPTTPHIDLDLGVPTRGFAKGWLRGLPSQPELELDGDAIPHFWVYKDWFVLSTSPRLSEEILKTARKRFLSGYKLPEETPAAAFEYGIIPEQAVTRMADILLAWCRTPLLWTFAEDGPQAARLATTRRDLDSVLSLCSQLGHSLGPIEWHTTPGQGRCEMRLSATFRDTVPR